MIIFTRVRNAQLSEKPLIDVESESEIDVIRVKLLKLCFLPKSPQRSSQVARGAPRLLIRPAGLPPNQTAQRRHGAFPTTSTELAVDHLRTQSRIRQRKRRKHPRH
jgi:hypothetical protein